MSFMVIRTLPLLCTTYLSMFRDLLENPDQGDLLDLLENLYDTQTHAYSVHVTIVAHMLKAMCFLPRALLDQMELQALLVHQETR